MIQEQAHRLPSGQGTGQEQKGNLPMIKLDAIASRSMNGSLQTAGTMTQVAGVAFVTIENDHSQAVNIRQGFVPFQTLVNVVNPLPQPLGIEQSMDTSQSVGAEGRLSEPTPPEAVPADLFPRVPTTHACQRQNH